MTMLLPFLLTPHHPALHQYHCHMIKQIQKNINLDFAFRDLLTQGFKWKLKFTAQIWLFN